MVKETPSLGRIAAMVVFTLSVFGLLMFLWLSFGGPIPLRPEGYRFTVPMPEAATLVQEADVRLAGVNVGKVKGKELDKRGARSLVEIELENRYAPIPRNTRAILRQKTLLGETYVELSPGNPRKGMLRDGGSLRPGNVQATVELDEIFRIFDERTRRNFQKWVDDGAVVVAGDYAEDFNDALGNLAPFATDGSKLLRILDDQEVAVRRVVRNTGRVFGALAAEEGQLRGLIVNGNDTFEALASRDESLAQTFEVFPTFLRESRATLARLETFSRDTRPLVRDLKGPADDLGPTVRDLGDLAPDLRRLFRDLDPLIRVSRSGLPAGARFIDGAEPVLEALHVFLPELNPVLAYLSFQRGVVARFITIGGHALAGNGRGAYRSGSSGGDHWLPQIALIDSTTFESFTERPEFDRGNAYIAPNAYERAIQLGIVESFDCDSEEPPGEKRDPEDPVFIPPNVQIGGEPPCFVQPRSLFQGQQFPFLRAGQAPIVPEPSGRDGTEPATP
jgi:virulence factor Mce-like protein